MLCAKCMSLFDGPAVEEPLHEAALSATMRTGAHHHSLQHLKTASDNGCYLCYELYLEYEEYQTTADNLPVRNAPEFLSYHLEAQSRQICSLWFVFRDVDFTTRVYEIVRTASVEIPTNYGNVRAAARFDLSSEPCRVRDDGFEVLRSNISESTGDIQVAGLARKWLTQCLKAHQHCGQLSSSQKSPWYPKRLLDISSVDGRPKLILTTYAKPSARYATLSHCWGENHAMCTLTDVNMAAYQHGIPLEVLTKTFRDAITTARRLQLKYIWIDSLCIQQSGPGSQEDWLEHAGAMRLVYTNSILNICAARAESGRDGLFVDRPRTQVLPCYLVWTSFLFPGEAQSVWIIRNTMRHTAAALRMLPLFTRGWVVQERFLAPRNLHFGSDRIWWECNDLALAEESHPMGFQEEGTKYEPIVQWPFSLFNTLETPRDLPLQTITDPQREMWEDLIEQYKQCDLSFPEQDTFLAFAGVAEMFGQKYNHEYVAGLFRQHLPFTLLWTSQGERSQTPRAPTWSWASIDGQVLTRVTANCPLCDRCCNRLATVQDVYLDLVDRRNIYGPVKTAQLTLRGRLVPCRVQHTKSFNTGLLQRILLYTHLGPEASPPPPGSPSDPQTTVSGEAQIDSEEDATTSMISVDHFNVWALPVAEVIPMLYPHSIWRRHQGLLLKRVGEGKYARIGVYYVAGYLPKLAEQLRSFTQDVCLV